MKNLQKMRIADLPSNDLVTSCFSLPFSVKSATRFGVASDLLVSVHARQFSGAPARVSFHRNFQKRLRGLSMRRLSQRLLKPE